MILLFQLLSITITALFVFYIIGNILIKSLRLRQNKSFFDLYLSLIVGLSVVVSTYAVISTLGSTVQLPLLIFIFIMLIALRFESRTEMSLSEIRSEFINLSILFFIALFSFFIQYLILYDTTSDYLQTPFQDYVYYSRLTLPLNQLGIETNSLETIYPQFQTEQPYHYLEIWLNALLVRITKMPSVWVFFISSASILITIVTIGYIAIFSHFKITTGRAVILALLFLFVTGLRLDPLQYYDFIKNGALLSSSLLCLQPRLAPVYLFIILALLLLLNKRYVSASVTLAIIPLTFVSTTPVISIVVVIISMYLFITHELSSRRSLIMVLPVIITTSYIILFYLSQPEPYQFPDASRILALTSIIPDISEIKTLFNITLGVFINYIISYGPYVVLVAFIAILQKKRGITFNMPLVIVVWFIISLVSAAAVRAFGNHFLDSFQFFSNIMVPLTPVLLAGLLAAILEKASLRLYVLSIVGLFLLINLNSAETVNTRYSSNFINQVAKVIPQLGSRGSYIMADEDYKNAYMLSSDSYTTGNYISNFKNNYTYTSLSALDLDSLTLDPRFQRDSAQAEQIVRKSTIYRFAKFQALNNQKLSLDSIKYKFVTQNNISFICLSKRAKFPFVLRSLIDTCYKDSLSGERLFILKNKYNG